MSNMDGHIIDGQHRCKYQVLRYPTYHKLDLENFQNVKFRLKAINYSLDCPKLFNPIRNQKFIVQKTFQIVLSKHMDQKQWL